MIVMVIQKISDVSMVPIRRARKKYFPDIASVGISYILCFCAVTTGHYKVVARQTGRNNVLRWTKSAIDPDKGNWETIALNPLQRQ
jgi:hypothetical protein